MSNALILIYIFLGGGLGSLSRYSIGVMTQSDNKFPLGTFLSNILACILLGAVVFWLKDKINDSSFIKYFIIVGFCGGFSTFSTFSLETVQLLKDGYFAMGILNVLASILLAFAILWALTK